MYVCDVVQDNRSSIKPDSMTVKQVLGGGLNQSTALALLGGAPGGGVSGMVHNVTSLLYYGMIQVLIFRNGNGHIRIISQFGSQSRSIEESRSIRQ